MQVVSDVAKCHDIPAAFYNALRDASLIAGEREAVMLTYLAAQTRRFDGSVFRPVGLTGYGQSSSGKTYSQDLAVRSVPDDGVVRITGMSDKLLTRKSTADFAGKVVILGEAEALKSTDVAYYLRKLFDDGHLTYEVLVDGISDEGTSIMVPRRYELGPGAWFSLMTSTTKPIHAENATRQLTVYSDDSDEQTRRVLRVSAQRIERGAVFDASPWQEFDHWQSNQDWSAVNIPYLSALADKVTISGPALRRSFMAVAALIAAHALLHRETRGLDDDGRVVATGEDYQAVRSLVEPFLAREAMVVIPGQLSDIIKAVTELTSVNGGAFHETGVTVEQLKTKLGGSRATLYRRVNEAVSAGLIECNTRSYPRRYFAVDGVAASSDISYILPPLEVLLESGEESMGYDGVMRMAFGPHPEV